MGEEWLTSICQALQQIGIPADSGFPGGVRRHIGQAVAAVGLRDLDYSAGTAVFEIRVVSPRVLGGWHCQSKAAEAVAALEALEIRCRMEPMEYHSDRDCFQVLILGRWTVLESGIEVRIGTELVSGVVEFTAELDRQRRVIESAWGQDPVGATPGRNVWKIRMVQVARRNQSIYGMPEEPFSLMVTEQGLWTVYGACRWNRVEKRMEPGRVTVTWEGFAMERREPGDGISEIQES